MEFLKRAIQSVMSQSYPALALAISNDIKKEGAWHNRMRALHMAKTEWIAFLDDDDEFLPHHLSTLISTALEHQADCAYGWFQVIGGTDPFPQYRGVQYDPLTSPTVPITYLAKRELLMDSPGFQIDKDNWGSWVNQDKPVIDYMFNNGKMIAISDITWNWYHHGKNTSGLPSRW